MSNLNPGIRCLLMWFMSSGKLRYKVPAKLIQISVLRAEENLLLDLLLHFGADHLVSLVAD